MYSKSIDLACLKHSHCEKTSAFFSLFPFFFKENKIYVTTLMAENKESIWKILDSGGHIYVCG